MLERCTLRSGRRISILQRRSGTRQRCTQCGRAVSAIDAAGGGIWPGIAPPAQGSPRERARILSAGTSKALISRRARAKATARASARATARAKAKGTSGGAGNAESLATRPTNAHPVQYEGGTDDTDVGSIWMIGNIGAEDWVEVPPGLRKRCTRSARTTRTRTSVSNRYELLADRSRGTPTTRKGSMSWRGENMVCNARRPRKATGSCTEKWMLKFEQWNQEWRV